jgi:hypothetical protein
MHTLFSGNVIFSFNVVSIDESPTFVNICENNWIGHLIPGSNNSVPWVGPAHQSVYSP